MAVLTYELHLTTPTSRWIPNLDDYATHYQVRKNIEHEHPQCDFCQHRTERTFSVREATHHVSLKKGANGVAFACVSCWSDLKRCDDG